MRRKVYLTVTISQDIFREIERLRGREKRSTFVEYILVQGLSSYLQESSKKHGRKTLILK